MYKKIAVTSVLLFLLLHPSLAQSPVVLDTLQVQHIDFEGKTRQGVIICNHQITKTKKPPPLTR